MGDWFRVAGGMGAESPGRGLASFAKRRAADRASPHWVKTWVILGGRQRPAREVWKMFGGKELSADSADSRRFGVVVGSGVGTASPRSGDQVTGEK